jgi:hypothetical protein
MGYIMEKPLVLIIEDDQAQNQIFKIALKDDFVVETFLDGDSAAARLDKVIPALVVLVAPAPNSLPASALTTASPAYASFWPPPMNRKRTGSKMTPISSCSSPSVPGN